jgi:hypothetical protein
MAGEWIPVDCNISTKPEILELADATGAPYDAVVGRVVCFWAWVGINCADGVIRATPRRLAHVAGGDEAFWLAVQDVGWLTFREDGTAEVKGWERRFSGAAKARAAGAKRQDKFRKSTPNEKPRNAPALHHRNGTPSRPSNGGPSPEEKRGEEKRGEDRTDTPSLRSCVSSGDATRATADGGDIQGIWETFRQAWNGTPNTKPWNALGCPSEAIGLVTDPSFVQGYPAALERLRASKFFTDPAALTWFLRNWSRVLAGEFDGRTERGAKPKRRIIDLEEEPV